jgi:hypothetical protein
MKNLKKFDQLNESSASGFFNNAYDVDDYRWSKPENKQFIATLVDSLLELSETEDNNVNHYITEMSKDKQDFLVRLGNLIHTKE